METLSTGVWGALRAGIWPSLGGAGYRQGPCRASTNCHTKGLSPCRGLKCCPHSAHLPMGLDPGLIPPPLESFPVPARKDSNLWCVCLHFHCVLRVWGKWHEHLLSSSLGEFNIPAGTSRESAWTSKTHKSTVTEAGVVSLPVQRTWDFDMDQRVQRLLRLWAGHQPGNSLPCILPLIF